MSYDFTSDFINEAKPSLNRHSGGSGGGGVMMVNMSFENVKVVDGNLEFVDITADKTPTEVLDAINSGSFIVVALDLMILTGPKIYIPLISSDTTSAAFQFQRNGEIHDIFLDTESGWSGGITPAQ